MKERLPPKQLCFVIGWRRALVVALLVWWCVDAAFAAQVMNPKIPKSQGICGLWSLAS